MLCWQSWTTWNMKLFGEGVLSPVRSVGSPDNGPQSILDVIGKALLEIHQSNKQRDEQINFLLSKHDVASVSHLDFQPEVFTTDKKLSSRQQWSRGGETWILSQSLGMLFGMYS
ncbi:hypothetical protein O6H91_13G049000 [Diphasiastrum complanatum]|uniref:Uncharacterized protein n=1 Tax=Diphasiastrum complanatum TaxID=34168 RepID=A0ACC2BV67_DIPCM|nr:hypothetical protein O6H91_13G049000 [Diphasiastrum complanatum]